MEAGLPALEMERLHDLPGWSAERRMPQWKYEASRLQRIEHWRYS